ncbi:YqaA family protein [Parathalassolituus penaei]|uniref:DedA family protein n=1 Tax=Parathalassolituus penaei TaxID=2997323 RepID=A0A9X3EBV4_9GAMM|nr:YqaA family protein [Parathalassolituus penaei]MCY0964692.1 DedA family protein [Parathalassolituus penaei]
MMEWLATLGPAGLFIAAFVAATLLPMGSELLLAALVVSGEPLLGMVLIATVGNVLGSCTNYLLGIWLPVERLRAISRMSEQELANARERLQRYGKWSLLLAWLPVIGDPLTLVAGIVRVPWHWFLLLVTTGKGLRYWLVAVAAQPLIN